MPRQLQAFASVRTWIERDRLGTIIDKKDELGRLLEQARQARAELEEDTAWLTENFDQPAPEDVDVGWLAQAVDEASAKQREIEKEFRPAVAEFNELLLPRGSLPAEIEHLVREWIEILEGWLTHYSQLHEMVSRHLTERRFSTDQVLQPRPVDGEIDYEELIRDTIARFPKILAALAK